MNRVKVTLHGILAEQVGEKEWNLKAANVRDAIRGVQSSCKKFYTCLLNNDKKNIKYRVLINEQDFLIEEGKDPSTPEGLKSSQLCLEKISNLKSIDIVPVIEGSEDWFDWFTIILGVALIWIGAPMAMGAAGWGSMYGAAVVAGIGLVAAGVANLLTPDPEFDDFREIEGGGRPSYTFSGPQNVTNEGGPVFVGYGRLLVGSQVIQASNDIADASAGVPFTKNPNKGNNNIVWGRTDYGLRYNMRGTDQRLYKRILQINKPFAT